MNRHPYCEGMQRIPTAQDIARLGRQIDSDGFTPHQRAVATLAELVTSVAPDDVCAAVLADAMAPSIARERAFCRLVARWSDHEASLRLKRSALFDDSFAELLDAWRTREELRSKGAPVGDLLVARMALDESRLDVAKTRPCTV